MQSGRIPDRAERGHRRFATERIVMTRRLRRELGECTHRRALAALAERPRGHLDDRLVLVAQRFRQIHIRTVGGELTPSSADFGSPIGERTHQVRVAEDAEPLQRSESGGPHRGRVVPEGSASSGGVSDEAGQSNSAATVGDVCGVISWGFTGCGDADGRRFRGRLHWGITGVTGSRWIPMRRSDHHNTMAADDDLIEAAGPVGTAPPVTAGRQKRRRWPWVVLLVFAAAVAISARVDLNYYAIQPGTAESVQQYITVPKDKERPVKHPVLLTDVLLGRVTALNYLFYELQGNTDLLPLDSVTGGTPAAQLDAQGDLEMSQAESYAKAAALTHLGYKVPAIPSGAVIFATFPGTPAYSALNVGDVVSAVNGVRTPTAVDLDKSLSHYHSGQTVTLTVQRGGTGRRVPVAVTLKRTVVNLGGGQKATFNLGIESEDQIDYVYPFPVTIDVTNIGGPSAGLAMTLGVIDALDGGSLTGGHTVAATGTIDAKGDVGEIGGAAQKTVAVENAGASIFLVPKGNYKEAMSTDRPGLKIYPVSTLDQALAILIAHGGSVQGNASTASSRRAG